MTLWKGFQKPKRLEVDTETLSGTYGKFYAQPFERGFGTTIGNALRRVLLSSIEGAAITAVKIEGVLHEFSSLPGVVEDVTDIILNLKQIPIKMHTNEEKIITLDVERKGKVTAADLQGDSTIEILDPDAPIATLSENGRLQMEMRVSIGRGYVSADKNFDEDMGIGYIPIDSVHSPVRRVQLPRRGGPHRPGHGLRPARAGGLDQRHGLAGRRRGSGGHASARPPDDLRQRRARDGPRGGRGRRAAGEPGGVPQPVGGRARALRAQRELPEERRDPDDPGPGAEDREGHARDEELRPQVARTRSATSCVPWASPSAWSSSRPKREASRSPCSTTEPGASSGRTTSHRLAMFSNQLASLLTHERIETTLIEGQGAAARWPRRSSRPPRATGWRRAARVPAGSPTAHRQAGVRDRRPPFRGPAGRLHADPPAREPQGRRRRGRDPGVRGLQVRAEGQGAHGRSRSPTAPAAPPEAASRRSARRKRRREEGGEGRRPARPGPGRRRPSRGEKKEKAPRQGPRKGPSRTGPSKRGTS